jgi:hypothetical protein
MGALAGDRRIRERKEGLEMPTFQTPEPISVSLDLGVGNIRIAAGDRTDTVVEVRPSDPANAADVTAAEQTRVAFADGRLSVKAPKGWRQHTWLAGRESIDVEIALPAGSRLDGEASAAALHSTGRVGELRYKTGVGAIRLDRTGSVQVRTGAGDISVERAVGRAEIATGSGTVELGAVDGPAIVKNSNGDTWIGDAEGELLANAANGKIAVDRAQATVRAKTANGDIVLGTVARGEIEAKTGLGKVDVGVADGVPAWLELRTNYGNVRNELEAADRPEHGEASVSIRARTGHGDITIHRAVGTEHAVMNA